MKILYALATLALAVALHSAVDAAEYRITFSVVNGPAESFTLFEIVGNERITLAEIPGADRELIIDIETPTSGCKSLVMAARIGSGYGPYSNVDGICARYPLPAPYVQPGTVEDMDIERVQ